MPYDVLIVGGGPAGLSAALALGRARKQVLLCDAGPRRNAAAVHMHNFVTRDGTPPQEFRAIARQQLQAYPNVTIRDAHVGAITGTRGAFQATVGGENITARRVILCTGMIDELPSIEGFRERWGHAIAQCPYCHGWEAREQRWGYLAHGPHAAQFPMLLRAWTRDVTVFTNHEMHLDADVLARFQSAGIRVETRAIAGLLGPAPQLERIVFTDGESVPCEMLFAHPPQRQVDLVRASGVALDDEGFVRIDAMTRETSVPGIHAAGDLTTRGQAAILAASAGMQAAAAINHELTAELAIAGLL